MEVGFFYHPQIEKYDFGEGHPFRGRRFQIFLNFFKERFPDFKNYFQHILGSPASDQLLCLVHTQDYIDVVKSASSGIEVPYLFHYLSSDNINPLTGRFPQGIDEAARAIVGSSAEALEMVARGSLKKAIVIGGGLHHAQPDFGEGFCIYNDIAIGVENLKRKYKLERILVLDTDAHAGNGVAQFFYNDPCVLFIDLHQDPTTIYPGTGFIHQIGEGKGKGFTINLPLPVGASNKSYQYLFEEIIFPLAREFSPQLMIRYGGSDPHYLDNLTNLGLTLEGFKMIGSYTREIAEEVCQARSVDLVTSGYNEELLPFCWAALIASVLNQEVDLGDFKERNLPGSDFKLDETKEMAHSLKKLLKDYWRCMGK